MRVVVRRPMGVMMGVRRSEGRAMGVVVMLALVLACPVRPEDSRVHELELHGLARHDEAVEKPGETEAGETLAIGFGLWVDRA